MNALVWEAPRAMAMREQVVPVPAAGEVLVKVAYAGICGSELSGYLGHNALRVPPLVMGHEFAGEVVEASQWSRQNSGLRGDSLAAAMNGVDALLPVAADPSPADKAADVTRDAVLSWKPGLAGQKHDVYFGAGFDDVNAATVAAPRGVLAGAGQDANTLDPAGLLQYGKTYYWRIDEVNSTPDATVLKGSTWFFTAEPFSAKARSTSCSRKSSRIRQRAMARRRSLVSGRDF